MPSKYTTDKNDYILDEHEPWSIEELKLQYTTEYDSVNPCLDISSKARVDLEALRLGYEVYDTQDPVAVKYDKDKLHSESPIEISSTLNIFFCGDIVKQEYLREHILCHGIGDMFEFSRLKCHGFHKEFQRFIDQKDNNTEYIYISDCGVINAGWKDIYFFDYKPSEKHLKDIFPKEYAIRDDEEPLIIFPVFNERKMIRFKCLRWVEDGI
jgi:hypothetical protein